MGMQDTRCIHCGSLCNARDRDLVRWRSRSHSGRHLQPRRASATIWCQSHCFGARLRRLCVAHHPHVRCCASSCDILLSNENARNSSLHRWERASERADQYYCSKPFNVDGTIKINSLHWQLSNLPNVEMHNCMLMFFFPKIEMHGSRSFWFLPI